MADKAFKSLDKDNSGSLSPDEVKAGVIKLGEAIGKKWSKADVEWMEKTGKAIDTGTPNEFDEQEFYLFGNAMLEHFKLCYLVEQKQPTNPANEGCLSHKTTDGFYKELDTDKSGSLSYAEIKVGLDKL